MRKPLACIGLAACICALLGACGPTYRKERVKESIVDICKKEYKIDVKATTVGKTIGIYIPLSDLIDFTFAISKSASDKINDVILTVTRVTISTDAHFDFYCIIAHDVRIPEIQIVIIKSVEDVRHFLLSDISRGEYSKRMIVDMRLSPQAQKERTIKGIFEKMKLDKKWQEEVLDDFFRTEPSTLGDIGYWNERFYLKDVTLPEFLAEQIASRVRLEFREDQDLAKKTTMKSSKGEYRIRGATRTFRFELLPLTKEGAGPPDETERAIFQKVLGIASHVLHAYRFSDFESVEIVEQRSEKILNISREDLENFRMRKLKLDDILTRNLKAGQIFM